MAETTGKDMPATDPKPTVVGKTGPVKPPVLEGTARPSATGKPADSASSAKLSDKPGTASTSTPASTPAGKPASSTPPPKPRDPPETGNGGGGAWLAGIVGGLIGLGAAYGLAWFGLWPSPEQAPAPADPRLAQFATAIPELETVTGTVQDELATLTSRVGALETSQTETPPAAAAPAAADSALAEEVAALSARLDDLAATAGTAVSSGELAALQTELATLKAEVAGTRAQLAQSEQAMAQISQSADETAGANAATLRLPLIFSGLDAAFVSGRPYESELAALRQALPDTIVPEPVAAHAASGLPRPEMVQVELVAALPAMLAGRPADAQASWQDATADWFRGLIALRPAGAVEGDGPDATIARLEAAVERRDFVTARNEFAALPETMRNASGTVGGDIETLAAAQDFLTQLRATALNGESGA